MSTFNGIVREFPRVQIDNFRCYEEHQPPLACFLSHVHSDHLTGLESLNSPFVYCTAPTRELLLRLERYPHRMNFAKGILETRKQTYRKVKRLLKPIPLETPTCIELARGYTIQVTLFDANHCTGACMFLIEGQGKAILYTGDVRSESWWVNSLVRNPVLISYAVGHRRLDSIYLDTTFAMVDALTMDFPTKADGLAELLSKVDEYPEDAVFYMDAWTFGYEEVWIALSKALHSKVHLCDYRYRVYSSMEAVPECFSPHSASLLGFQLANGRHEGCLTKSPDGVRLHSCEKGSQCDILKNPDVVRVTPIITRHKGIEIAEMGTGGGQGDLDQVHELELNDIMAVAQLIAMCGEQLKNQPELHAEVVGWLEKLVRSGRGTAKLDFDGFWELVKGNSDTDDPLDDIPLDRLVPALAKLVIGKSREEGTRSAPNKRITFPFSRHSSYRELRCLVEAFKPKDLYPCTVTANGWIPDVSMKSLFGDVCSADIFWHDQLMLARMRGKKMQAQRESSEHIDDIESPPITPIHHPDLAPAGHEKCGSHIALSSPRKRPRTAIRPETDGSKFRRGLDFVQDEDSSSMKSATRCSIDNVPLAASASADHIRTPSLANISATSILGTRSSGRAVRRAEISAEVKLGSPWGGLRSVKGYHNQKKEEEL